jgi:hypothetical protein
MRSTTTSNASPTIIAAPRVWPTGCAHSVSPSPRSTPTWCSLISRRQRLDAFRQHIDAAGVRMSIGYTPRIRMVTHLDIDDAAVERTIDVFAKFMR